MNSLDFYEVVYIGPESITCVFPAIRTGMEKPVLSFLCTAFMFLCKNVVGERTQ